jgi:hypothetical protein
MKFYITEETKQELEAKIAELELKRDQAAEDNDEAYANNCIGQILAYYEILSSATILPVEESYNDIQHFETSEHGTVIRKHLLMANYPNGVIIQPKQEKL